MGYYDLVGKTFTSVVQDGDDAIRFKVGDTTAYSLLHTQDCCESVSIEDVCGDLSDLEGTEILEASESSEHDDSVESGTWSFFKFRTRKGYVTVRFYGSSNGYYSESASLYPHLSEEEMEKLFPTKPKVEEPLPIPKTRKAKADTRKVFQLRVLRLAGWHLKDFKKLENALKTAMRDTGLEYHEAEFRLSNDYNKEEESLDYQKDI